MPIGSDLLFSDTFDGSAATDLAAHNAAWTERGGSWLLDGSGAVQAQAGQGNYASAYVDPSRANDDYSVAFTYTLGSGSSCGIWGRRNNRTTDSSGYVVYRASGPNIVVERRQVNGANSTIYNSAEPASGWAAGINQVDFETTDTTEVTITIHSSLNGTTVDVVDNNANALLSGDVGIYSTDASTGAKWQIFQLYGTSNSLIASSQLLSMIANQGGF